MTYRLIERFGCALLLGVLCAVGGARANTPQNEPGADGDAAHAALPNIVLITVDTLRADRLSMYGNPAPTSPNIDALLSAGGHFNAARTIEPLTAPAAASMLTSLYPHEHGVSRNGIPIRDGLHSLPSMLLHLNYVTAAFVSNWTLADKQSGLAEHFDVFGEVLTKKRWLFWFGEASAEDVRLRTLEWLEEDGVYPGQPLFLWVHFVEPHAPYKLHEEYADKLGVPTDGSATIMQQYDTEIAAVDHEIGLLLDDLREYIDVDESLLIFASDHGEGLEEHGYKGHGRHLYEEELRIPLGFTWKDHIQAAAFDAPATLLDLPPTVMGLLGAPKPQEWRGHDWSESLRTGEDGDMGRITYYQAHKGAVKGGAKKARVAARKRQRGLVQLGIIEGSDKRVLDLEQGTISSYQLRPVPKSGVLEYAGSETSPEQSANLPADLKDWRTTVNQELAERDRSPPPELDEEAIEILRSLGYTN
jgi:arylsulfatase A-like enzyme